MSLDTESGPQPVSASSSRYYFVGVEENVIQKSFDTSGNPGDSRRLDADHVAELTDGVNTDFEDFGQTNRSEVNWLYNLNQGAGLTENTALFLGGSEQGGEDGTKICPGCCVEYECSCKNQSCVIPEDCLRFIQPPVDPGEGSQCPEPTCKRCDRGCFDQITQNCPWWFGSDGPKQTLKNAYYEWYEGRANGACIWDRVEEWEAQCNDSLSGCCEHADLIPFVYRDDPEINTLAMLWGGCCPGCAGGGDKCCNREGKSAACGCDGNGNGDRGADCCKCGQGSPEFHSEGLPNPSPQPMTEVDALGGAFQANLGLGIIDWLCCFLGIKSCCSSSSGGGGGGGGGGGPQAPPCNPANCGQHNIGIRCYDCLSICTWIVTCLARRVGAVGKASWNKIQQCCITDCTRLSGTQKPGIQVFTCCLLREFCSANIPKSPPVMSNLCALLQNFGLLGPNVNCANYNICSGSAKQTLGC